MGYRIPTTAVAGQAVMTPVRPAVASTGPAQVAVDDDALVGAPAVQDGFSAGPVAQLRPAVRDLSHHILTTRPVAMKGAAEHAERTMGASLQVEANEYNQRYEELGEIGQGGQGLIVKVRDTTTQELRAAKKIAFTEVDDRERFERECRAYALLDNAYFAKVHDVYRVSGDFVIVMDFVEGENLAEFLERKKGNLTEEEIINIGNQLREALTYLRGQGMIHRDIKLTNIMLTPEGRIKIVDFATTRFDTEHTSTRTRRWDYTSYYASPEQLNGGEITFKTDIWSAGMVIATLALGREVTDREGRRLSADEILTLFHQRDKYSAQFLDALRDMLRVDAGQRFWGLAFGVQSLSSGPRAQGKISTWQRITRVVKAWSDAIWGDTNKWQNLYDTIQKYGTHPHHVHDVDSIRDLTRRDGQGQDLLTLVYMKDGGSNSEIGLKILERGVRSKHALLMAIKCQEEDLALRLLEENPELAEVVDPSGETAVSLVLKKGMEQVLSRLIDLGVPVNFDYGNLRKDGVWWNTVMAELYIRRMGGRVTFVHESDNEHLKGKTNLMGACICPWSSEEIALELIDRGTSLNDTDANGMNALMHACGRGWDDVAIRLIEKGVSLPHKNVFGKTALSFALDQGMLRTMIFMIQKDPLLIFQINSSGAPLWKMIGGELDVRQQVWDTIMGILQKRLDEDPQVIFRVVEKQQIWREILNGDFPDSLKDKVKEIVANLTSPPT